MEKTDKSKRLRKKQNSVGDFLLARFHCQSVKSAKEIDGKNKETSPKEDSSLVADCCDEC